MDTLAGILCADPRAGEKAAAALAVAARAGAAIAQPGGAWLFPGGGGGAYFEDAEAGAAIAYTGELYNCAGLRRELESGGCRFRTGLESELALRAWLRWGPACQEKFNGEWAFAVWQRRSRRLFCSRDRFGLRPFFYHAGKGFFSFCSEPRPLLFCPGVPRDPDEGAIYDYLRFNENRQPEETFYRSVRKLRAGHCLAMPAVSPEPRPENWYRPGYNTELGDRDPAAMRRRAAVFRDLLEDSVRIRLCQPPRLGALLSGGLDSSSIACLAGRLLKGKAGRPPAISIPWPEEAGFIRESARRSGLRVSAVAPSAVAAAGWEEVASAAAAATKPVNETSLPGEIRLLRKARELGVEVLLDGSGGDELLAGYHNKYFSVYLNQVLKCRGVAAFNAEFRAMHAGRLEEFNIFGEPPKDFYKIFLRTQRNSAEVSEVLADETLQPDFLRAHAGRGPQRGGLPDFNLQEVLRRDTLALGGELEHIVPFRFRLPLLDHRVVEYALSLPASSMVRDGWNKYLLREAMRGVLPEKVRARREKVGGSVPQPAWKSFLLRNSGRLKESLGGPRRLSAPYVSRKGVLKNFGRLLAAGTAPGASDVSALWRFANLELWLAENEAALKPAAAPDKAR